MSLPNEVKPVCLKKTVSVTYVLFCSLLKLCCEYRLALCGQLALPCSALDVKWFWTKVLISRKPTQAESQIDKKSTIPGDWGVVGTVTGTSLLRCECVLGNRWHSGHFWAVTERSHWGNWVTGAWPASFALARRQAYHCDSAGINGSELLLCLCVLRETPAL